MAAPKLSPGASAGLSFIASLGIGFVMGRFTAQNGPRLGNLEAAGGEYGVPMPRGYGEKVRLTGAFIAQDDIEEHKHKTSSKAAAVAAGAIGGAAEGFLIGGPVGAAIGAGVGAVLGFASPNHYYYTYSDTFALFFLDRTNDDPIEGLQKLWSSGKLIFSASQSSVVSETLDGDGKLIRRKYGKNKYFKSLTVYGGHTDQTVDPILAAEVDEESGYVFSAYVVIEDLQLDTFGNSVPAVDGLVNVKSGQTFAEVVEAICASADIDPDTEISSTALINYPMRGYTITSESTCFDAIKPLLPVFGVDVADVAGQIRFYKRSQTMRGTILPDDMGSYTYGESPPPRFMFRRENDLNLPQETSLTFVDPDRDFQANTATSARSEGSSSSNIAVSVNVVLSAGEGATTAALMHWDAWLGRTEVNFSLTDAWIGIEAGLAYAIPVADQYVPYRVTRKTRGANGIIEVEALSDESVTYTASVAGSSGTIPDEESTAFPDTRLVFIDGPIIQDRHDEYGYYIAMAGSEASWTRGSIESSPDGITFTTILDEPFQTVMGDVTGTLTAGTTDGLDDTLDTTTVLTVVLLHDGMELSSATDDELDGWANFAYVGKDGLGEYLQWKTATKVGVATWELTDLRRGRRGTDWAIATHASGEEFAVLDGEGLYRFVYSDETDWGNEYTFRGVTLHQDSDDADEQTFTNTGEGKRPFSPVNVEGTWDGSYNLTATFDSRSRLFAGGLGIDDNFEFDVEITNATPVRSMTVSAETFSYSAADQVTDGLIAGQIVEGRVRQTSDVNDGRWREFIIFGPLASTADSTLIFADTTLLTADMA
jgi:hypothetical protein